MVAAFRGSDWKGQEGASGTPVTLLLDLGGGHVEGSQRRRPRFQFPGSTGAGPPHYCFFLCKCIGLKIANFLEKSLVCVPKSSVLPSLLGQLFPPPPGPNPAFIHSLEYECLLLLKISIHSVPIY